MTERLSTHACREQDDAGLPRKRSNYGTTPAKSLQSCLTLQPQVLYFFPMQPQCRGPSWIHRQRDSSSLKNSIIVAEPQAACLMTENEPCPPGNAHCHSQQDPGYAESPLYTKVLLGGRSLLGAYGLSFQARNRNLVAQSFFGR